MILRRSLIPVVTAAVVGAACFASAAHAQHPVDVQRLTAKSEHYKAMIEYAKIPRRRVTPDSAIAAGRSAWALGLPEKALAEFDKAGQFEGLSDEQEAFIIVSKGIIELQEGRYQVAALQAEKAVAKIIEGAPIRTKAWLLWGESLLRLNQAGAAEEKFLKAVEEAPATEKAEINYHLGVCRVALAKYDEARSNFEAIPISHDRTPMAIRQLALIALERADYQKAEYWLSKGQAEYPESFLDSWVDYARVDIAIHSNDSEKVKELVSKASEKYPPSDSWLSLLLAASESFLWQNSAKDQ